MLIEKIESDKRDYLDLLLIGDESEVMIDRYLDAGTMYVGKIDGKPMAVCVTVKVADDMVEVKNLAVSPDFQRCGYGRQMLAHVENINRAMTVMLGTGESPSNLAFYKACGYVYSHRIPRFFIDNYDHPIIEDGVVLRDMVYLVKRKDY